MKTKQPKLKTYIASAVWLHNVPLEHRGNNGSRQFTILVKAKSVAEVARLTGNSQHHLRIYSGVHPAPEMVGITSLSQPVTNIVKKDGVVYYRPDNWWAGHKQQWFEYHKKETNP